MGERWIARARQTVPFPTRETCFDPVAADLQWTLASRLTDSGRWRHAVWRLWFLIQLWRAAFQCRRLHASSLARSERHAMFESAIRALRHAARRLIRQPRFTVTVACTLALGLGANITVFTFVDAFLLSPLPVPQPDRLLRVAEVRDGEADITSYPNYRDVRDTTAGVLDLAAHVQVEVQVGDIDGGRLATAELVSGNYFRVMRLAPQAGRLLAEHDSQNELAHPYAVISDRYWRQHMGGAANAVGQRLIINGAAFEIVGIAPPGFDGTYVAHQVDLWVPIVMQGWVRPRGLSVERRTWGWLRMIGRIDDAATLERAEQAIERAAAGINREFPPARVSDAVAFAAFPATALSTDDAEGLTPVLAVSFAFTALLFLATCANLTGILQSRLASRAREIAIRQSLGAGRLRLAGEWMAECVLLAMLGGILALAVGIAGTRAVGAMDIPTELVGQVSFSAAMGWRVLAYTFAVSLVGGVLLGAGTAWRAARRTPLTTLKADGGTQVGGANATRGRRLTVVLQVACSAVLLVVAGLLAFSLSRQTAADPGFDADRLGLMSLSLQRQRVPQGEWRALTDRALSAALSTPGVQNVATAMRAPLGLGEDVQSVRIPGYTPPDDRPTVTVDFNTVSASYFDTLGLRFVAGGSWPASVAEAPAVVINETMAKRFWQDGDALGRAIVVGSTSGVVAGVVTDSAYYAIGETPRPMLYLPAEFQAGGNFGLFVRTDGDPSAVAANVARTLAAEDVRLTPANVMSFADLRQVPLFPARLLTMTAVAFGAVSLLLTVVGLYGVIAGSVADRSREIGVRLALGAEPWRVQRGVIREALVLALVGLVVGTIASAAVAAAMRDWLFTVSPFDPAVYAIVLALITVVAVASAWWPARAAAAVDPVRVLR
jgi:predicted permease